jgi:hypothetical protein
MDSVQTYSILSKPSFDSPIGFTFPPSYKPVPTEKDYKKGTMRRAFCLYISSGKIVEIKLKDTIKYSKNYFLKVKTVTWKITGPERNVYKNNILFDRGVYEINMETINNLQNSGFKNIKNFLYPLDLYKK